jgi:hypothetical protein
MRKVEGELEVNSRFENPKSKMDEGRGGGGGGGGRRAIVGAFILHFVG